MKRLVFSLLLAFVIPVTSFAASATPTVTQDTAQTLSTALASLSQSIAGLASSTADITIANGQIGIGHDVRSNGELQITNQGLYHTVVTSLNQPTVELSKIILEYIPCSGPSSTGCASSQSFPPEPSEMSAGQSTNYLNYLISLMSYSTTSATYEITDQTAFANVQSQLSDLSSRIAAWVSAHK